MEAEETSRAARDAASALARAPARVVVTTPAPNEAHTREIVRPSQCDTPGSRASRRTALDSKAPL